MRHLAAVVYSFLGLLFLFLVAVGQMRTEFLAIGFGHIVIGLLWWWDVHEVVQDDSARAKATLVLTGTVVLVAAMLALRAI